ncbi:MAG: glycosyltransferase [Gammaproteobacteria bacterium]|nr:glycosyltransferase [Gammaproteobacteria bacterium]
MQPFSVSVILPNYNGRHLLEKNIPSIINALHGIDHEIIVVDDCSSDDSVLFLKNSYPEVTVVQNERNLGFSATCNLGVTKATRPLLCIANTDVTFTPTYFHTTLPHFQNSNLFAAKGPIINYNNDFNNIINTEKTSLLYYHHGFLRFNQRVTPAPDTFNGRIGGQFVLLGCCFVCDRAKMLQLGGFDEIFSPFYWEDADLALRALRRGYQLAFEPECRVFHATSSTIATFRSKTRRRLVSIRNKFLFSWRHLHGAEQWAIHTSFVLLSLLTRWCILDWKYYIAFTSALVRAHHFKVRKA